MKLKFQNFLDAHFQNVDFHQGLGRAPFLLRVFQVMNPPSVNDIHGTVLGIQGSVIIVQMDGGLTMKVDGSKLKWADFLDHGDHDRLRAISGHSVVLETNIPGSLKIVDIHLKQ